MMRTYELNLDEFLSNVVFTSAFDISRRDGYIEINEDNVRDFIAEQTSHLTETLLYSLHVREKREEAYSFDNVARDILEDRYGFHFFQCPHCGRRNYKSEWNESDVIEPRCLECGEKIEMKG